MVLMIPIRNRHGWRIKIHFQQNDGSALKAQLVAFEIYSYDIITEGYFDSLLYEHGIDSSQIVLMRLIGF